MLGFRCRCSWRQFQDQGEYLTSIYGVFLKRGVLFKVCLPVLSIRYHIWGGKNSNLWGESYRNNGDKSRRMNFGNYFGQISHQNECSQPSLLLCEGWHRFALLSSVSASVGCPNVKRTVPIIGSLQMIQQRSKEGPDIMDALLGGWLVMSSVNIMI